MNPTSATPVDRVELVAGYGVRWRAGGEGPVLVWAHDALACIDADDESPVVDFDVLSARHRLIRFDAIGGGTTSVSGTSMASPSAAGCAALLVEAGMTAPAAIEEVATQAGDRDLTPQLRTEKETELVFVDLARGRQRLGGSILAQVFEQIKAGEAATLNLIIKADVAGSVEVLRQQLEAVGTDEVQCRVIHAMVGQISVNRPRLR